jgi:hypothetical protein
MSFSQRQILETLSLECPLGVVASVPLVPGLPEKGINNTSSVALHWRDSCTGLSGHHVCDAGGSVLLFSLEFLYLVVISSCHPAVVAVFQLDTPVGILAA